MSEFTHLDEDGRARMVDISQKQPTVREATAEGWVRLPASVEAAIARQAVEKGDVLAVAQLAGIQAVKRTSDLIPLCHPLPIDGVDVSVELEKGAVRIEATVRTTWRTGVEMEALTAVTVAGLTVIDMAKALDKGMVLDGVCLLRKTGGKTGPWQRQAGPDGG